MVIGFALALQAVSLKHSEENCSIFKKMCFVRPSFPSFRASDYLPKTTSEDPY